MKGLKGLENVSGVLPKRDKKQEKGPAFRHVPEMESREMAEWRGLCEEVKVLREELLNSYASRDTQILAMVENLEDSEILEDIQRLIKNKDKLKEDVDSLKKQVRSLVSARSAGVRRPPKDLTELGSCV